MQTTQGQVYTSISKIECCVCVMVCFVNRYLMKSASQVQEGKAPPSSLSFLSRKPELCPITRGDEFLDPRVQRQIYQDRTLRCVERQ